MKEQTSKLNETNVSFDKSVNVFDNYEKAAPISDSSHKDQLNASGRGANKSYEIPTI